MTDRKLNQKIQAYPRVALVLQGGGALGSYQAGVYEGLAHAGIHPNWVAGISIGSLNCAIIAGNPPEKRVERLHEFWDTICSPPMCPAHLLDNPFAAMFGAGVGTSGHGSGGAGRCLGAGAGNGFGNFLGMHSPVANPWAGMFDGAAQAMFGSMAAMNAIMSGQSGFFTPRLMGPGSGSPDQTSFYDTSPILETLERFADFDRINSGETRVSLGATNVASGNFVYFDTETTKLTPKHFLASGSLPPGFPATEIDGEYYWDGGCVSNTPLEYVLGTSPRKDTLVFQVDLWSAQGPLPTDVLQVTERLKDIQYSSRTRTVTNVVHLAQQMRKVLIDTVERIPQEVRDKDPWFQEIVHRMMGARYNVIHLIYRNKANEGHYKDYQFSNETMRMHWQTGQHDMNETLEFPECLEMPAEGENFVTFDIHSRKRSSSQFHEKQASKSAQQAPAHGVADKKSPVGRVQAAKPPALKDSPGTPVKPSARTTSKVAVKASGTAVKASGSRRPPRPAPK